MEIYTNSPEETKNIARNLAKYLDKGDIILLSGDLGAGKTLFTKGLGSGLDIDNPITSPTFTLMQEYHGRLTLYHFDLYRIEDPEELIEVGLFDYMYDDGVTVIEWFEKMEDFESLEEYLKIKIFVEDNSRRRLVLSSQGERYDNLLKIIKEEGANLTL
ncbi:tRNA (adenosine(37)-N6)-threonylcarbamoyltransferase complex ATPase subunit type 1 TsaE [Natranaerofaba carboxydovora]|uniref:tRNA (adenosine(37)-N6)-threonylcarbamoyltransferase complex ATPase subunit type 1 TsaE n=1 Tax=Natranaerofaba carboxydovora TaxID=2742683 RepID=UPI001F133BF1|nr:tRNA (adenosine(37)-N6)-threonylcarbamoyltransferase complex ATPase subunit type 1 TsaE [Natranaerofaba carboxydovora]UMZ74854.1 tRNA threonylcarbamoyladenosine biosynthesis protein TsaE [Natranaerofaba carboxydovora]